MKMVSLQLKESVRTILIILTDKSCILCDLALINGLFLVIV